MNLSRFFTALAFGSTVTASILLAGSNQSWAQGGNGFFCDETQAPPAMVLAGDGSVIKMITFTSDWAPPPYSPKIRCQVVSARFQSALVRYGSPDWFSKITFGYQENRPVWCLSRNSSEQRQGICAPNEEILLTFQNEWQGCNFLPRFLEIILRQVGTVDAEMTRSFATLQQGCNQNFSSQGGRATPQERESFIALNAFLSSSSSSSATVNSSPSYLLREEGELNRQSPRLESDNSAYQSYTFQGRAGQVITIELSSREFDTYLFLVDPAGESIAENDDISNSDSNSRIEVRLPSNGMYTIIANGFERNNYGRYLLTIR